MLSTSVERSAASEDRPEDRVHIVSTGVLECLTLVRPFRRGLRDLGYVEGKKSYRKPLCRGQAGSDPRIVNDLIQQKVDVIVAVNNVIIRAAKEATKTIPIVILSSVDPVTAGYVESFVHPGANITGLAHLGRDLSAKRVELLKELLPKMSRIAILWDAAGPGPAIAFKEYEGRGARFQNLEVDPLKYAVPNPDFPGAFQAAENGSLGCVIVVANPLMGERAKQVFEISHKKTPRDHDRGKPATSRTAA